jgi:hypothetical protein
MGAGATIDDAAADAVKQVMEATVAEAKSGMIAEICRGFQVARF